MKRDNRSVRRGSSEPSQIDDCERFTTKDTKGYNALENEVSRVRYQCAGCGEWNETTIDPSGGRRQEYVEDCQVCCKPNVLRVEWGDGEWWVRSELE